MSTPDPHSSSHDAQVRWPQPQRFNISRWALEHPALTRYLMVVLMVMGFAAYFQLGQDEDPPFTFRAMVIQAFWPGATAQQMSQQVIKPLETVLTENIAEIDYVKSKARPGQATLNITLPKAETAGKNEFRGTVKEEVIIGTVTVGNGPGQTQYPWSAKLVARASAVK